MPTFELEMNGKSYEVDAPSIEAFQQAYHGGQPDQSGGDFLHPVKPAPGSGLSGVLERLGQYPRMFLGEINDAGETLGKVSRGELDATDPEAIKSALTIGSTLSPTTVGRVNAAKDIMTPGLEAAQTAAGAGAPLPAGLVSQTPGIQAATQASRRLPFVGQNIEGRVSDTLKAVGNKVGDIAEDLSGGAVPEKSTLGADTRTALQNIIENNNDTIGSFYNELRQSHIKPNMFSSVKNTKEVFEDIGADRWKAGEDRVSGLADVRRLISSGKPFDGLIRARSKIGADLGANKANPNPGFPTADLKRLYGAITKDIESAVQAPANLRPGVTANDALASFRSANDTAKDLIDKNANIQRILNIKTDEGVAGNILNMTKGKTSGNARMLGELRGQMTDEDFHKVVGSWLNDLGAKPSVPGGFSLNQLASRWNDTPSTIKSIMLRDPAHREAVDKIARLGDFLKDADKYINHSGTSGANAMSALIGAVAGGHIPEALGAMAGGFGLGKILGRPASASALQKWITIAKDKASEGGRWTPGRMAVFNIAGRNLLNNLPAEAQASESQPSGREPLRVTVHPKAQDRMLTAP